MVKPFRFGVQCGGDRDRADLEQLARKIEALGYSTFYVPDHFIDTQMAPIIAMAVAAEATATLRVGALVFDNDYKHPAILAKEIATLDRLSDGRVGARHRRRLDEGRLRGTRAGLRPGRCARRPVGGGACRHQGLLGLGGLQLRRRALHDHGLQRHPEADPAAAPADPRGRWWTAVLRLAGREADIVGINPNLRAGTVTNDAATNSVAEMVDQKVGWIREGAGRALRRPRAADPVLLRRDHR